VHLDLRHDAFWAAVASLRSLQAWNGKTTANALWAYATQYGADCDAGIAEALLQRVCEHAESRRCRA